MNDLENIAADLRSAQKTVSAIAPVRSRLAENDAASAYEIQQINTRHGLKQGRSISGRKIGLTSIAVQQQLGVNQPDFGVLFTDMARTEHENIDAGQLINPRIETEVAMVLGKPVTGPDITMADILRSIDYVVPALEIVDSRIEGWDISITDTIADNASSALYVLGTQKRSLTGLDLRLCGMVMENQSGPVSQGVGAACMGNPLNAVLWLARKLLEFDSPLEEGDVILSGALGPMVQVRPGDVFHARVGNLGAVSARFGGAA